LTQHDVRKNSSLYLLASLAIFSFSTAAVMSLMVYPARSSTSSLLDFIGETLPYTLFAGISSYYFARWALRHRRLAVIIVAIMFLGSFAYATYLAPKPETLTQVTEGANATGVVEYVLVNRTDIVLGANPVIPTATRFQTPTPTLATFMMAIVQAGVILIVIIWGILVPRLKGVSQLRISRVPKLEVEESHLEFGDEIRAAIVGYYRSAVQSVRRRGVQVKGSDTPRRVEDNVCRNIPQICSPFTSLTKLLEEARYSLHSMTDDHREKAADSYRTIESASNS